MYGSDRSESGKGPVAGPCKHGNETSGSIKCSEIFEWRLIKKGSAPWTWLVRGDISYITVDCVQIIIAHASSLCLFDFLVVYT
jgi:hypothetical protein